MCVPRASVVPKVVVAEEAVLVRESRSGMRTKTWKTSFFPGEEKTYQIEFEITVGRMLSLRGFGTVVIREWKR